MLHGAYIGAPVNRTDAPFISPRRSLPHTLTSNGSRVYLLPMTIAPSPRTTAILQALFVTLLWSTSWVLIKIGLQDLPALTFAGLRYVLAFLCLLPVLVFSGHGKSLRSLALGDWARLVLLGLVLYTATQGAMFLSLAYLPAVTVSLVLNMTTIVVALFGILLLSERPTVLQFAGVALNAVGLVIYFVPAAWPEGEFFGLLVAIVALAANAGASLLGRSVNRRGVVHPLVVTSVSMGAGAAALLGIGILVQGFPSLTVVHWGIIAWLAVVNTALAFTLWNLTLRHLSAIESSIINNTMLIQIAVLAWLFLGEALSWQAVIGLVLAGAGAMIVQMRHPVFGTNHAESQKKAAKWRNV